MWCVFRVGCGVWDVCVSVVLQPKHDPYPCLTDCLLLFCVLQIMMYAMSIVRKSLYELERRGRCVLVVE